MLNVIQGIMVVTALNFANAEEPEPSKHAAGVVFRAIPEATKIQIEITTKGENSYRATFKIEGKTNVEVGDLVTKQLKRKHWDVEAKGTGLVRIRGFLPTDGEVEPITAITITIWASDPRSPPPYPNIGGVGIKTKLLVQMEPGPALEEKPNGK